MRPNALIPPCALEEAKRTKYPIVRKNVAGIRLRKNTSVPILLLIYPRAFGFNASP
jgi:hypothetical protein